MCVCVCESLNAQTRNSVNSVLSNEKTKKRSEREHWRRQQSQRMLPFPHMNEEPCTAPPALHSTTFYDNTHVHTCSGLFSSGGGSVRWRDVDRSHEIQKIFLSRDTSFRNSSISSHTYPPPPPLPHSFTPSLLFQSCTSVRLKKKKKKPSCRTSSRSSLSSPESLIGG